MKFGKLANIEQVDFSLPADPTGTSRVLVEHSQDGNPLDFFVGCTGWSMKEWVGHIYPKGAKAKEYLRYYAEQFNTIELNTTHYRIPSLEMIEKWKTESTPDFKFCPKVPQIISHSRNLGIGQDGIINFCEAIQKLEEKLGCCFMQLPPYFGLDRLALLEQFFQQWPNHIPLAIEVRHESWFETTKAQETLFEVLEKYRISTVITDVAGRRDVLHMRLTTPIAMVRFVGNDLHTTDYSRINDWVSRLLEWQKLGLKEVYYFTHEPDNLKAPELAQYLVEQVKEQPNINIRGPKIPYEAQGQQMELF